MKAKVSPRFKVDLAWRATTLYVELWYNLAKVCSCPPVHVGSSCSKSCWKWKESRPYFGSHPSSADQCLLSGSAPCAAGTFSHTEKLKLTVHKHFPTCLQVYIWTVVLIIRFIHVGKLQRQHLSPAFPIYVQYIDWFLLCLDSTYKMQEKTHIKWKRLIIPINAFQVHC